MDNYFIGHASSYTNIDNSLFEDKYGLSMEAMGLLAYLTSRPPNWQIRNSHLESKFGVGKFKLNKVFQELEAKGFLIRINISLGNGGFEWRRMIAPSPERLEAWKRDNPEILAKAIAGSTGSKKRKRISSEEKIPVSQFPVSQKLGYARVSQKLGYITNTECYIADAGGTDFLRQSTPISDRCMEGSPPLSEIPSPSERRDLDSRMVTPPPTCHTITDIPQNEPVTTTDSGLSKSSRDDLRYRADTELDLIEFALSRGLKLRIPFNLKALMDAATDEQLIEGITAIKRAIVLGDVENIAGYGVATFKRILGRAEKTVDEVVEVEPVEPVDTVDNRPVPDVEDLKLITRNHAMYLKEGNPGALHRWWKTIGQQVIWKAPSGEFSLLLDEVDEEKGHVLGYKFTVEDDGSISLYCGGEREPGDDRPPSSPIRFLARFDELVLDS